MIRRSLFKGVDSTLSPLASWIFLLVTCVAVLGLGRLWIELIT